MSPVALSCAVTGLSPLLASWSMLLSRIRRCRLLTERLGVQSEWYKNYCRLCWLAIIDLYFINEAWSYLICFILLIFELLLFRVFLQRSLVAYITLTSTRSGNSCFLTNFNCKGDRVLQIILWQKSQSLLFGNANCTAVLYFKKPYFSMVTK